MNSCQFPKRLTVVVLVILKAVFNFYYYLCYFFFFYWIYRRKLRSEVGNAFSSLSQEMLSEIIPNKEDMTVMRIMSHSGQNVTVYCLSGEPVFYEIERRIFPTGTNQSIINQ